jgi:hydrogenase nickel incorporation protein HypB
MTRPPVEISAEQEESAINTRMRLSDSQVLAVQINGAPGTGKTSLIRATIDRLAERSRVGVIIAYRAAERDADQLRHSAAAVVAMDCDRFEPDQVRRGIDLLDLNKLNILLLETPTEQPVDLGEQARVALFSVTGGDDKAVEFPQRVSGADLVLLSKIDLLPFVKFDPRLFRGDVARLNSQAELIELSLSDGVGLDDWVKWLVSRQMSMLPRQEVSNPSLPEWWFG